MPSSPDGAVQEREHDHLLAGRPAGARVGSGSRAGRRRRRASRAAAAGAAGERVRCGSRDGTQSPSAGDADGRERRSARGSAARSTWAAVTHDTSCSADWPPNSTTRRTRLGDASVGHAAECRQRAMRRPAATGSDRPIAASGSPIRVSHDARAMRMRPSRSPPRSVASCSAATPSVDGATIDSRLGAARASSSCRSWPSATATTSSAPRSRPGAAGLPDRRARSRRRTAIRVADTADRAARPRPPRPRPRLPDRVVGITGCVGKTSTKDLLAAVLAHHATSPRRASGRSTTSSACRSRWSTRRTAPRRRSSRWAPGASATSPTLCDVARPTIGVVTVVAGAHLEVFGTIDDVGAGQGRAGRGAARRRHGGAQRRRRAGGGDGRRGPAPRVLTFGRGAARCGPTAVRLDDELRPRVPAAHARGATPTSRLARPRRAPGHQRAGRRGRRSGGRRRRSTAWPRAWPAPTLSACGWSSTRRPAGARVLNDAYNANPTSMGAALDALAALAGRRGASPCSGRWPSSAPTRRREHAGIAARAPATLGIRVIAVAEPGLRGRRRPDAVASTSTSALGPARARSAPATPSW